MAGGTPSNSNISYSMTPTQNNRLQQQRVDMGNTGINGGGTQMGGSHQRANMGNTQLNPNVRTFTQTQGPQMGGNQYGQNTYMGGGFGQQAQATGMTAGGQQFSTSYSPSPSQGASAMGGWGGAPQTPAQGGGGWGTSYWGNNNQGGGSNPLGNITTDMGMPPRQGQMPTFNAPSYSPSLPAYTPGSLGSGLQAGTGALPGQSPLNVGAGVGQVETPWGLLPVSTNPSPGIPTPQAPAPVPGAAQATPYNVAGTQTPVGITAEFWNGLNNNGGQQAHIMNYMSMMQPYIQMQQNANQWGAEFNEQNRRFDNQFGWQQQQDAFNMGLSGYDRWLAGDQARVAAEQWATQHDWQRQMDTAGMGLAYDQLNAQTGLGYAGLQNQAGMQQADIANQQYMQSANIANQQYMQNAGFGHESSMQQANIANQQYMQQAGFGHEAAMQQAGFGQQSRLQASDIANQQYMQQAGFQQQAGMQQAGFGQERFINQQNIQAEAARQQAQIAAQMGMQQSGFGNERYMQQAGFGQERFMQGSQQQFQAQQAALQRAQEERLATMQAFGRAQGPQARMVRNF